MQESTVLPMPRWKRSIDIFGSLFLLIVLSPLMLLIVVYIKTVSPGPVLYKSQRVGYKGKLFTFLKFRTMVFDNGEQVDYHKDHRKYTTNFIRNGNIPMTKLDGKDNRIFPGGNFLRLTCLDELVQLINILRGEMSLVGPRPCIPYEAKAYWRRYGSSNITRFDVVPGLTGLWQVSGKNSLTYREMIDLDITYVKSVSFWLDIRILLKTLPTVIELALEPLFFTCSHYFEYVRIRVVYFAMVVLVLMMALPLFG